MEKNSMGTLYECILEMRDSIGKLRKDVGEKCDRLDKNLQFLEDSLKYAFKCSQPNGSDVLGRLEQLSERLDTLEGLVQKGAFSQKQVADVPETLASGGSGQAEEEPQFVKKLAKVTGEQNVSSSLKGGQEAENDGAGKGERDNTANEGLQDDVKVYEGDNNLRGTDKRHEQRNEWDSAELKAIYEQEGADFLRNYNAPEAEQVVKDTLGLGVRGSDQKKLFNLVVNREDISNLAKEDICLIEGSLKCKYCAKEIKYRDEGGCTYYLAAPTKGSTFNSQSIILSAYAYFFDVVGSYYNLQNCILLKPAILKKDAEGLFHLVSKGEIKFA